MSRKIRIFVEKTPQHIMLKSLNDLVLCRDESDYETLMKILSNLLSKYQVEMHAYVLVENYFEYIATPKTLDSLPKFMQSLGRLYVSYYNKKYNRSGTIWEGRYKSSLVEDKTYLFKVMKYIEQKKPITYIYSSVGTNLFNKDDDIITKHELYKNLAYTDFNRIREYSGIFNQKNKDETNTFICNCLEKQLVTGNVDFVKNLEKIVGTTLISKSRGRPKKIFENKRKKMYKNLVVLDKEQHKELKISSPENLSFAKGLTFIPVIASEVEKVGAAFPVVFTADENPMLISLVSLGGDNLALNADNKWITSYVPSYLRKYPFSLAATQENPEKKVILIDEESSLFSKSKGKQLFKKNTEQSETLTHAINFLTNHDNQVSVTTNVAKMISDSGILEDREISVGEGDEKKVLVNGFKVVNREKLNALSDDILADWVRKGIMTMIDGHIKSLDNIQTLFNIAHQRQN